MKTGVAVNVVITATVIRKDGTRQEVTARGCAGNK